MPKGIYQRNPEKFPYGSRVLTPEQEIEISELYSLGENQENLAKKFGVGRGCIRRSLRRTKTSTIGRKGLPMEKNPAWKGGRRIDADGYVQIRTPGGYILEHRLVMEELIGRQLSPNEVVHHKNGKKADNSPENLLLFRNNGEHLGVELLGKIPNWTEDGRRRIASRSIPSMKGTVQCPRGTGVRQSRRKLIQKFLHETSGLQDSGPVAELMPLPPCPKRTKKEHEKEPQPTNDLGLIKQYHPLGRR